MKEAVLLDLLRVISHHRARLATPIRTVQKSYSDADTENIPFSDTIFSRAGTPINRPLLLIEHPSRISGDDKSKHRTPPRSDDDELNKTIAASEPMPTQVAEGTIQNNSDKKQKQKAISKLDTSEVSPSTISSKSQLEGSDKPSLAEAPSEHAEVAVPLTAKNDTEKPPSTSSPSAATRSVFEDNIVLGMALEGSKRTLPMDEEETGLGATPLEAGEVAAMHGSSSSNVKETKGQMPAPGTAAKDRRDQER